MLLREFCHCYETIPGRGFASLMEMYESNYIRFRRFCPELHVIAEKAVFTAVDAPDLHLRVTARGRYTTTVGLTYYFSSSKGRLRAEPNLKLRVYHDARQAEVLSCVWRNENAHLIFRRSWNGSTLAVKWKRNHFLGRWLDYCLRQRYRCSWEDGRRRNCSWPFGAGGRLALE